MTEDSDAFLFGARTVYKNIFSDKKFVEVCIAIYGVFIYLSIYLFYGVSTWGRMEDGSSSSFIKHHISSVGVPRRRRSE